MDTVDTALQSPNSAPAVEHCSTSAAAAAPPPRPHPPPPPPPQIGKASAAIHHTSSLALVPCLHPHPLRSRGRSELPAVAERPFPDRHEVRDGEMTQDISCVGEASALGRNVFGVRTVFYPVAMMRVADRRRLGKRLRSELDAVRDLLRKAEQYSCVPGKDGRLFAPGAAVVEDDDDGCRAAKRRKVCPFAERARVSKHGDRERLAGRLASMAATLPDHVVAFLQNRRVGDADSRGDDGEVEMDDVLSMKDGDLFTLKMLLDKFAPESAPKLPLADMFAPEVSTPKGRGGRAPLAASGISCLSQAEHQETGGRMPPVQEEEEEEEGVNICGGVSRIAIRDIAEEFMDGTGLQLLSPLQRKYVELAVEDGYVDICGDASPVVFPAKTGNSSSPSLSSSFDDSNATSTDSDSSSSSPEALLPKENSYCRAGEPVPAPEVDPIQRVHNAQSPRAAPEAIHIAEPENQCAAATVFAVTKSPPAPEADPIQGVHNAQPPRAAPEATHITEPENQCAAATVITVTSPPAPTVLPKECGALAQPPEHAPEAVQNIAEPEELNKEKCAAPGATVVHPITNENGTSSQPAPVAAHVAEPQPQPQPQPQRQGVPTTTSALIAMAQQEAKRRAMAKARQELLKVERAALPDERMRIHPRDMELLGISPFEHIVTTVRDARTAQPQENDGVGLSFSPGGPSILQQLGVFLKADSCGEEEEEEPPPPLAVASDGEEIDMEIEEGQIL